MVTGTFCMSSKLAGAVALAVVAAACSTPTTETNVWRSPTYAAGPMKSIVVFGGRVNATDRRTLEDGYVSALTSYGVHATPSYSLFPQGEVPKDQAGVRAALQQGGYDGALISTLQGVSEQVLVAPSAGWDPGFYGAYWGPGAPAYAETEQFVKFETTLWNVNSGTMVWSAVTQTPNPSSGAKFVSSLAGKIVPSLSQAGLIPGKQGAQVSLAQ
jgi:hypothetical protein